MSAPSSSLSKRSSQGGDVSNFVFGVCETNKKILKDLAERLAADDELHVDISDLKTAVLEKSIRVLEVEQFTSIMADKVTCSIREFRSTEQERRRQAEKVNGEDDNDDNSRNEKENTLNIMDKATKKRKLTDLVDETKQQLSKFEHKNTAWYKEIEMELKMDDNEVILQSTRLCDADFICPYSQVPFEQPMSNNHPKYSCKHHLDEASLKSMCKGKKQEKCPVSGCSGLWILSHTSFDKNFERKMQRHRASKKKESTNYAVEEDAEYTAV